MHQSPDCFLRFQDPVDTVVLPERFTYPFYYEPHPLCVQAAAELQQRLADPEWEHDFGEETDTSGESIGKMFGVLVVQNTAGEIGYLAAFSGKMAGKYHLDGFVPPVFDLYQENGFYRKGELELGVLTGRIETLEQNPRLPELQQLLREESAESLRQLDAERERARAAKQARKMQREAADQDAPEALKALETALIQESKQDHFILKDLKRQWQERLQSIQDQLDSIVNEITELKDLRKATSNGLQQQIFEQYTFLNQSGAQKSLADIFLRAAAQPPAGAGECAAPKLLQYAFLHQLNPIAMAEFWWGASPVGEIRRHGSFYPACRGKCEPILGHMLEGMSLDINPLRLSPEEELPIEILYEDEYLLVINKAPGLLSVPGKSDMDSVYLRMKRLYPDATGPMIVHRLDMSTSGLMLVAKTMEVYKTLQSQFIKRSIKKRYVALLEGLVPADTGIIEMPLRVDLDDRPRQMVCYEYGKAARTDWKVLSRTENRTRILFYPITGRTHQLRVHAAHALGLNCPIVGDDIYGNKSDRLYLHAAYLEFVHPVSEERVVVEAAAGF